MPSYHASFCILGEVTGMQIVDKPSRRLLIDISARPQTDQDAFDFVYRTSFSVLDPDLIDELCEQIATGDVIEASGSFWQTGYIPHKNGYIDTTFCLTGYRLVEKQAVSAGRYNPYHGLLRDLRIH